MFEFHNFIVVLKLLLSIVSFWSDKIMKVSVT